MGHITLRGAKGEAKTLPHGGRTVYKDTISPKGSKHRRRLFRTIPHTINIRSRKKHEKCTVTHRKNINLFFQQYRMPMNTKFFTLLCASCLAQLTSAQHFTRWWNDVEVASAKDQPKTALKSLQLIRKEALRSGNTAQLLRALFTEQVMQQEIAPDSGAVMSELIERELAKEQRPVERALWLNALGRLYADRARSSWRNEDTAAVRKAHDFLLESVQQTALLGAARTRYYTTLFDFGADSKQIYGDDLLSVLTATLVSAYEDNSYRPIKKEEVQEVLQRNLAYYRQSGKELAALHTELDIADLIEPKKQEEFLRKVAKSYEKLPENSETLARLCQLLRKDRLDEAVALAKEGLQRYGKAAPELHNFLAEVEKPTIQVDWSSPELKTEGNAFYPAATYRALMTWNNMKSVKINFIRLKGVDASLKQLRAHGIDPEGYMGEQELRKLVTQVPHETALTLRKDLPALPAHRTATDSIEFRTPTAGVYVVELWAEDKLMERELATVSRGTLFLLKTAPDKEQRTYVDNKTGQPITDEKEMATVPPERRYQDYRLGDYRDPVMRTERGVHLYTDRPLYRPGQRVQYSALVYAREGDTYKVGANVKGTVKLLDSRHEKVAEQTVTTDAFGVATGEFTLPQYCRTGSFAVSMNTQGYNATTLDFKVEEYQRPKFEVKLDTLSSTLNSTDHVKVRGRVLTMNGQPVRNAEIKWDWELNKVWYWTNEETDNDEQLDGKGVTTTDDEGRFDFEVEMKADLKTYYRLSVNAAATAPDGETHETRRSAYVNLKQEEPAEEKPMITTKEEKSGDKATFTFSETATVVFDLVATQGGLVEHRIIDVQAGTTLPVEWKAAYGDAAKASVAYMKKGVHHQAELTVQRPAPDKRLLLKWNTFRSQLTPGQEETWTLSVTRPDGQPAEANVMARLYDASLDALIRQKKHREETSENESPWKFHYNFLRNLPTANFLRPLWYLPTLQGHLAGKGLLDIPSVEFTYWHNSMFDYRSERMMFAGANALRVTSFDMVLEKRAMEPAAPTRAKFEKLKEEKAAVPVRSNFSETAFFMPALRTDKNGVATLRFTLPESLTEWQFNAFAHDVQLNSGTLDDKITARKQLTAEVSVPRCLREGDEIDWPITVRNISGHTTQGKYALTIEDADQKRVLKTFNGQFNLADGKSFTDHFALRIPDGVQRLLVRVTANNNEFSDGEERLVPVLSRQIEVTRAVPFTLRRGESLQTKEAEARRKLMAQLDKGVNPTFTTDTCRDARTEVAKVVPEWMRVVDGSAYDQAVAFYGIQLASKLREHLSLSDYEIQAYRTSALDRMSALQNGDGSWPWFKGLQGSPYITAQIAVLLARAQVLTKDQTGSGLCNGALSFLYAEAKKEVKELKRIEKQQKTVVNSLPEWMYNYLYVCRLLERRETPTLAYIRKKLASENKTLTMYGKSAQAIALSGTTYEKVAQNALQSVVEHTVSSPEMGRYFDTDRAFGGWSSYRIPTQTFAIEALQRLAAQMPKIDGTDNAQLVDELKLWLLQSKRTQVWNTSRATTDAAYALLSQSAVANEGLAWGAVSARYKVDAAKVQAAGNGFRLERRFEVWRDEKWTKADDAVRVGERVRWVYTLTADRDFDHVSLKSTRPAGLEPRDPFSGVEWADGLLCYRMVRDAENEYFVEHLAKGKHVFTDESIVVRTGQFDGGIATVQSVFAPEFSATSTPMTLKVRP